MNAWTLAFSDAAMEEKYATHTFANSAAVFVDLCALAMAANFLMFVWYLVANESGAVGGAAIVFISCGFGMVITRAVARMQDQKRARVYFGRLNVLSMLVTMSSSLAYKNYYHLSEKVPARSSRLISPYPPSSEKPNRPPQHNRSLRRRRHHAAPSSRAHSTASHCACSLRTTCQSTASFL